jgi:hypothetical protein
MGDAMSGQRSYTRIAYESALGYGAVLTSGPWRLLGRHELFERQRVTLNKLEDGVAEHERVVFVVPAERCLVQIGGKVFHGKLVVRANHGAVKERPDRLNRVRVYLAAYPFVARVIDIFVSGVVVGDATVGTMRIRVDRLRVVMDNILKKALHGLTGSVRSHAKPNTAPTLE